MERRDVLVVLQFRFLIPSPAEKMKAANWRIGPEKRNHTRVPERTEGEGLLYYRVIVRPAERWSAKFQVQETSELS